MKEWWRTGDSEETSSGGNVQARGSKEKKETVFSKPQDGVV